MGCAICDRIKARQEAEKSELDFRAMSNRVVGKNGNVYQLNGPLMPPGRSPSGGWSVLIRINGRLHQIPGPSAQAVFASVRKLLHLNGKTLSDRDLWLNLNIQWIKKSSEKYQVVRLSDLMAVAAPLGNSSEVRFSATEWLLPVLNAICVWFASDYYSNEGLIQRIIDIQPLTDPVKNPLMGSPELFAETSRILDRLRQAPIYNRAEAREWFCVSFGLDFKTTAETYHWT